MKKCNKCNLEKNLELFSKCSNRKDGLKATCKNCDKKINEKYRKINTKKYFIKIAINIIMIIIIKIKKK